MALLTREAQGKVVDLLVSEGLADVEVVKKIRATTTKTKKPLLQTLIAEKIITNGAMMRASARVIGAQYVNLQNVQIPQEDLSLLPQNAAERSMAVSLGETGGQLVVAMLDISNVQATDYLATLTQKSIRAVMATEEGIRNVLSQYKGDFSSVSQAERATRYESLQEAAAAAASDTKTLSQDSPISKALNSILEYAAKSKASDVHIEPLEKALIIRCRVDGVLRQVMKLDKSMEPALVSRIKILANLKIDEHRIPQDGQFTVAIDGQEIDLRIAISPVVWGEQVVIRLLNKSDTAMEVEKMGMTGQALGTVLHGIAQPNGMILTSGPTGSGKSTTLYALIKKIKNESINIVTLEDPVEYKMDGVNQIQVNPDAGLTFASGLRSILRQDPDVVMVGEIRDTETANLAVQAALTGHLVFSTLHTNSAAGILPRLLDMGIEPFLLASTLNTVIGQRLVRRVAPKHETFQSSTAQTQEINKVVGSILPQSREQIPAVSETLGYNGLPLAGQTSYTLVRGLEDVDAPGGYVGRTGLFEAIDVDDDIQKLLTARATAGDIMKVAQAKGTVTLQQDGFLKALTGVTTLEEVYRVASDLV